MLNSFPTEVIESIAGYLCGAHVQRLSHCSSRLHSILANCKVIWLPLIADKFQITYLPELESQTPIAIRYDHLYQKAFWDRSLMGACRHLSMLVDEVINERVSYYVEQMKKGGICCHPDCNIKPPVSRNNRFKRKIAFLSSCFKSLGFMVMLVSQM